MNKLKENLKKIWSKITESKLNISMFAAGVIVFILLAVIMGIIIYRDGQVTNELIITVTKNDETTTPEVPTTTEYESETTSKPEEQYSTKIDENATTNIVSRASRLSANISIENSWTNDGKYFIQYSIDVTNVSDSDIDGWALVLDMARPYTLVDSWNYTFKTGNKKLIINPLNENRKIPAGETVSGGFIVKGTSYIYVDYITVYVGNKIETIKNRNTYIPASTSGGPARDDTTTLKPDYDTTTIQRPSSSNNATESSEENTTPKESPEESTPKEMPDETPDETPETIGSDNPTPNPGTTDIPKPAESTTPPKITTSTTPAIITPEDDTTTPAAQ